MGPLPGGRGPAIHVYDICVAEDSELQVQVTKWISLVTIGKASISHTPSGGLVARTDTPVQTREPAGSLDQFE